MESPMFNVGDVIVRKAYRNDKSVVSRDECTIIDFVSDEHPICPQMWYIVRDYRGRVRNGLQGVVDDAFCLKN